MNNEELIQTIHKKNRVIGNLRKNLMDMRANFLVLKKQLENIVNNIQFINSDSSKKASTTPRFYKGGKR